MKWKWKKTTENQCGFTYGTCFYARAGTNYLECEAHHWQYKCLYLEWIHKLTFPSAGNMTVTKTTATNDNYVLTAVRYMNLSDVGNDTQSPTDALFGSLQLYPNPVKDVINVQLAGDLNQQTTVQLLSIDGRVMFQTPLITTMSIDLSAFRRGIYLCRVSNGTSIFTSKFVKL